jgi:hypothetical protein
MAAPMSPARRRLSRRPAPHACPDLGLSNYVERGSVGWHTWRRFNPHGSIWHFVLQLIGGYGLTNEQQVLLDHEQYIEQRRCHTWQGMTWCFCERPA